MIMLIIPPGDLVLSLHTPFLSLHIILSLHYHLPHVFFSLNLGPRLTFQVLASLVYQLLLAARWRTWGVSQLLMSIYIPTNTF